MSGYCHCKCPDCFEIAVSSSNEDEFCWECSEAGCEEDSDCQVEQDEMENC